MSRRILLFIAFSAVTLFLAGFLLFGGNLHDGIINVGPPKDFSSRTLHIAIMESAGWHDEVVAALVHSFGSQKGAELSIYQRNQRYGIAAIMEAFQLFNPLPTSQSPDVFVNDKENAVRPDIVVATTCELDIIALSPRLASLLSEGNTFLFCVVHHADRWSSPELEGAIRPWVEKGMVDFVTLSPHTAKYLKVSGMSSWKTGALRSIRHFAPLFPVALPPLSRDGMGTNDELAFALQGNYEPSRRDFGTIFSQLENLINSASPDGDANKNASITLHLLGHGTRPTVPAPLATHVFFDEELAYSDYYAILSRTFALLPAFANREYLDRKASSSVPAALIGGTPLVATHEILSTYNYLTADAVYIQKEGETEVDVVGKILSLEGKHRIEKMEMVRKRCAQVIDGNVDLVEGWIKAALSKVGR